MSEDRHSGYTSGPRESAIGGNVRRPSFWLHIWATRERERYVLSNRVIAEVDDLIIKRHNKVGNSMDMPCTPTVTEYNRYMGAVDFNDKMFRLDKTQVVMIAVVVSGGGTKFNDCHVNIAVSASIERCLQRHIFHVNTQPSLFRGIHFMPISD